LSPRLLMPSRSFLPPVLYCAGTVPVPVLQQNPGRSGIACRHPCRLPIRWP
jgi:hypothetical protein